jgi:hypothetical protein
VSENPGVRENGGLAPSQARSTIFLTAFDYNTGAASRGGPSHFHAPTSVLRGESRVKHTGARETDVTAAAARGHRGARPAPRPRQGAGSVINPIVTLKKPRLSTAIDMIGNLV